MQHHNVSCAVSGVQAVRVLPLTQLQLHCCDHKPCLESVPLQAHERVARHGLVFYRVAIAALAASSLCTAVRVNRVSKGYLQHHAARQNVA
jgi:hypothetical protein